MKRILLIEDNDGHRQMLTEFLENENYEVIGAGDGEEGCRIFSQIPCDVIITDIFMPKKEGLQTILDLKTEYPDVKIIAISGGGVYDLQLANKIDSQAAFDVDGTNALRIAEILGADHVLEKPVNTSDLLEKIESID